MKKKSIFIIVASVIAVCVLGFFLSRLVDWKVRSESASGDIAKSSRFSRPAKTEKIKNLEELIQNDEKYKDGLVAASVVMQTRAAQFNALVDMSNEVAGDIPEYAAVLKDMNSARPMIANVCTSLVAAAHDLEACLAGEECPDLTQNTINASLAYSTLQKQNKLADQFIETTDRYVSEAEGNDRLLFVRDQWVDYQRMTAALNGDEQAAQELDAKGALLNAEKNIAALNSFDVYHQISLISGAQMSVTMDVDNQLSHTLSPDTFGQVFEIMAAGADVANQNIGKGIGDASVVTSHPGTLFRNTVSESLIEVSDNQLGHGSRLPTLNNNVDTDTFEQIFESLGSIPKIMSNFSEMEIAGSDAAMNYQIPRLCNELGDIIESTAVGAVPVIKFF